MNSLIGIFKKIGNLKDLVTKNKTSLVSSVNEVTTEQNSMKEQLSSSVQSIEAGLNYNTIKVVKNDGTTENILVKIQGGSNNSINVFKSSQSIGSYVATGTVNTFVIDDIDNTKDVDLVYNNFLLIRGVDYTVDKETGTIGLSFDLKENEVIYYILTNTSYDYNDLNNLPNIGDLQNLSTTSKEVVGGINELAKQINDCFQFKGECHNPDNCSEPGIYRIISTTTNNPLGSGVWGMLIVLMNPDGNAITQKAIRTVDGQLGYVEKSRTSYFTNPGRAWGKWVQISTTETVDASTLVLLNGFERHGDLSFGIVSRSGNNVHLSLLLVENGVGASYVSTIICALPFRPMANEIHFLDGYEFRTQVDGHLYLNGPLANTRRLIRLSINYTCA